MSSDNKITQMLEDGTKIEMVRRDGEDLVDIRITRPSGTGLAMYEVFAFRKEEAEALCRALITLEGAIADD